MKANHPCRGVSFFTPYLKPIDTTGDLDDAAGFSQLLPQILLLNLPMYFNDTLFYLVLMKDAIDVSNCGFTFYIHSIIFGPTLLAHIGLRLDYI